MCRQKLQVTLGVLKGKRCSLSLGHLFLPSHGPRHAGTGLAASIPPPGLQTRKIPARERRPCPFPGSPGLKSGQSCRHRGQPEIKTSLGQVWAGRGKVSGLGPNTLRQQVWALGEVGVAGKLPRPGTTQPCPEAGGWPRCPPTHSPAQTAALQCGTAGPQSLFLEWRLCQLPPE